MIKLITILGARPQFIKAVAVSAAIQKDYSDVISELILHTGQHFDENMSAVFFDELGLPQPHFRLHTASADKPLQIGEMIDGITAILKRESPDIVMVYGDTTSTLAGSLAASGLKIPLIHIEAGLRSFNKNMPEELNRIICDQLSTFLFTPTPVGVANLANEGITHDVNKPVAVSNPKVIQCGDVMYDVSLLFKSRIKSISWEECGLKEPGKRWILCTIHREQNTASADNLMNILESLLELPESQNCEIIWPVHPRTRKTLDNLPNRELVNNVFSHPSIHICEPVSYLQTQFLLNHCAIVLTDSGGLQKEAFFAAKPSVIMRSETEWVELLEQEYAILCDTDKSRLINAVSKQWQKDLKNAPTFYGNGHAAASILKTLTAHFQV